MKKIVVSGLALGALIVAGSVFAQTATSTATTTQNNKEVREAYKKNQEKMKEAHERTKATSTEVHANEKNFTQKHVSKAGVERANAMINRLNRKIEKLEKLAMHANERIAKYKTNGADTTSTEAKLADARLAINTAKAKVSTLTTGIQSALTSQPTATSTKSTLNNILKGIEPQVKEAEQAIHTANKAIRRAIKIHKPNSGGTTIPSVATTTNTQ